MKIITHDPRNIPAFLHLSDGVIRVLNKHSGSQEWASIAEACCAYFQRYGYDLQSGAWNMLAAFHAQGWQGLATAMSWQARALNGEEICWPPRSSSLLRTGVLAWLCQHVVTRMYTTPITVNDDSALQKIDEGLECLVALAKQEQAKESGEMLSNAQYYLYVQRRALAPRITARTELAVPPKEPVPSVAPARKLWRPVVSGFVVGAVLASLVGALFYVFDARVNSEREVEKLLATSAVERWQEAVKRSQQILDKQKREEWAQHLQLVSYQTGDITRWDRVIQRLDNLEKRLLEAERKQSRYMTISELKTEIYQLRKLLTEGMPVEAQLAEMEKKPASVTDAERMRFRQRIDALILRYILIEPMGGNSSVNIS